MTNREWLESLSDKQLADFLTHGIAVSYKIGERFFAEYVNIGSISRQYAQSNIGVEQWLNQENYYTLVDWREKK